MQTLKLIIAKSLVGMLLIPMFILFILGALVESISTTITKIMRGLDWICKALKQWSVR